VALGNGISGCTIGRIRFRQRIDERTGFDDDCSGRDTENSQNVRHFRNQRQCADDPRHRRWKDLRVSQQLFVAGFGSERPEYIRRISVNRLFDEVSYNVELSPVYGFRLGIFAGANGTGKTTLLRLAESVLTSRPERNKVFVQNIAFESFEVELVSGMRVGYRRSKGATVGPFTYYVIAPGQQKVELLFGPSPRGSAADHLSLSETVHPLLFICRPIGMPRHRSSQDHQSV
jgi:hypothetical protein